MVNDLKWEAYWKDIETIAKDGASVVIKLDGQRSEDNFYSVILSGGKLNDGFFRKDGSELNSLLKELIEYYNNNKDH